jgi:hypothetical protein
MSSVLSPGVKWSQFSNGGRPISGDEVVGIRAGVNTRFDLNAIVSQPYLSRQIIQNAHGFVVGNILRLNGAVYVLAQANAAANANVIGMVSGVIDVNTFDLTFGGYIPTLNGLTVGSLYFLSPFAAGASTLAAPNVPGQIYKPLLIADTATSCYWLNYQGNQL